MMMVLDLLATVTSTRILAVHGGESGTSCPARGFEVGGSFAQGTRQVIVLAFLIHVHVVCLACFVLSIVLGRSTVLAHHRCLQNDKS